MRYTLPSAIFKLLSLATAIYQTDSSLEPKTYKKIYDLASKLINKLSSIQPVLSIKLCLELISTINRIDESKFYDEFTYETFS